MELPDLSTEDLNTEMAFCIGVNNAADKVFAHKTEEHRITVMLLALALRLRKTYPQNSDKFARIVETCRKGLAESPQGSSYESLEREMTNFAN